VKGKGKTHHGVTESQRRGDEVEVKTHHGVTETRRRGMR
jgi:hypothetical protein